MLYAGAREKAFPSIFGNIKEKSGVPAYAVNFYLGIIALGATIIAVIGYAEAISHLLVSAAVFANWFMMALMNFALVIVRLKRKDLNPHFDIRLILKISLF